MANGKKSVLLYCDIIHTVEELSDDEAGRLFKHYLRYINDLNPEPPDKLIKIVFEPIKQTLKRDLKAWESIILKRSAAGIASAEKKKQNQQVSTSVESVEQTSTKSTVSDIVNVIVKDKVKVRSKTIFVAPLIWEVEIYLKEKGYTKEAALKIIEYYSVADWKDSKGTEVKNWKQKAQSVWFKPENKIKENIKSTDLTQTPLPK